MKTPPMGRFFATVTPTQMDTHGLPRLSPAHSCGYVEISAPTRAAAQELMTALFGGQWSMMYSDWNAIHEADRTLIGRIQLRWSGKYNADRADMIRRMTLAEVDETWIGIGCDTFDINRTKVFALRAFVAAGGALPADDIALLEMIDS